MKTARVDIRGLFQDASAFSGYIRFELSRPSQNDGALIMPQGPLSRVEFSAGQAEVHLIPNALLGEDTFYRFTLVRVDMRGRGITESTAFAGTCVVPDADCSITDIMDVNPGEQDAPTAEKYASEAKYASVQAEAQASAARESANKAEASAEDASLSAQTAAESAGSAAERAADALASRNVAEESAQSAATSAASAKEAETAAKTSETNARAHEEAAATSAADALASKNAASASASAASDSATQAADAVQGVADSLAAEVARATEAEQALAESIGAEASRATAEENAIKKSVSVNEERLQNHAKRIENLTAAAQGKNFVFQTDADAAYSKLVPAGAMPYAGVKSIGGKTLVWNQLIKANINELSKEKDGITITKSSGNQYSKITGTTTSSSVWLSYFASYICGGVIGGHKYYVTYGSKQVELTQWGMSDNTNMPGSVRSVIYTASNTTTYGYINLRFKPDVTYNFTINPQLFDLTLMFGAGNEPATVEEFEALFPADYYEYNAGELLSAGVSEVVSANRNLFNGKFSGTKTMSSSYYVEAYSRFDLSPYRGKKLVVSFDTESTVSPFSSSIGCGSISDYRSDFVTTSIESIQNRKTFLLDLSLQDHIDKMDKYGSFLAIRPVRYGIYQSYTASWSNLQIEIGNTATPYVPYKEHTAAIPMQVQNLPGYGWSAGTAKNWVDWEARTYHQEVASRAWEEGDTDNADVTTDGTTTHYVLNEPVITDLSDLLPEDNLIEVEAGGTLTFKNQHGDDYRIPVPSEVEHMINIEEAL